MRAKLPRFNALLITLTSILLISLTVLMTGDCTRARQSGPIPPPIVPKAPLTQEEKLTIKLFNQAAPSVVYITTTTIRRDFFTLNLYEIPQGAGSGFIWNKQGYIVTNFHVVQDADGVNVTLNDHSIWEAKIVGVEPDKDLAVLKIDAPPGKLHPIKIGTSRDLQVGQKVLAIGNPFGLDQTLTTGVISGLGREILSVSRRPIQGVIQTDAAINPGNSGGPLLDSSGRLIGINTAIYSPSGAYAGVGFAVPVDTVTRIVPQLIAYGRVKKPQLGISIAEDQILQRYGIEGVLTVNVLPGSPADRAGMLPTRRDFRGRLILGDIIVAIDGQPIKSNKDLYRALDKHQPGDTITVTVKRGRKLKKLKVVLGSH